MLAKLVLGQASSSDEQIWLISNFSFQPTLERRQLLKSLVKTHPGLFVVNLGKDDSIELPDNKNLWGLVPIFSSNQTVNQLDSFFERMLTSKASILTLYINDQDQPIDWSIADNLQIQFGKLLAPSDLMRFNNGQELKIYLQSKLSFFEQAQHSYLNRQSSPSEFKHQHQHTWDDIEKELLYLDEYEKCILERGNYKLYLTSFGQLQVIPKEIGRLRAITFERIGEGTGKDIDLDIYDQYYQQLFLVDIPNKKIVGGYRIGAGDTIIKKYGLEGLYVHALYHIHPSVESLLNKSIELGRSFIIPSYQKKSMPLFLLWHGILQFIQRHHQYQYILGMVSISRAYSDVSRSLIISYLKKHHYLPALASEFSARQEFHSTSSASTLDALVKVFNGELIRLDEFISEIEPENYRLPVLIRKYINQNARFIGFNLDPDFSDCVDGLMLLDIEEIPASTIQMLREK